jgi:hypothetical protein
MAVAKHLAGGRVDFDDKAVPVVDDQPITGGFKDAAVLLFSLTPFLLGVFELKHALLHLLQHALETGQQSPLH